jgi:hypothetical protein
MAGPADVDPDVERTDALARLLDEVRNALFVDLLAEPQVWGLLGIVGTVAGMAADDLRGGADAGRLHRRVDLLVEMTARFTAGAGQ